jgi:hypothetical protein
MNDEELLVQAANVSTMYFDGFGAFRKINGVLRCVGYTIGSGAQLNLIVSLTGAEVGIVEARRTLDEKPAKPISIFDRLQLAH